MKVIFKTKICVNMNAPQEFTQSTAVLMRSVILEVCIAVCSLFYLNWSKVVLKFRSCIHVVNLNSEITIANVSPAWI